MMHCIGYMRIIPLFSRISTEYNFEVEYLEQIISFSTLIFGFLVL